MGTPITIVEVAPDAPRPGTLDYMEFIERPQLLAIYDAAKAADDDAATFGAARALSDFYTRKRDYLENQRAIVPTRTCDTCGDVYIGSGDLHRCAPCRAQTRTYARPAEVIEPTYVAPRNVPQPIDTLALTASPATIADAPGSATSPHAPAATFAASPLLDLPPTADILAALHERHATALLHEDYPGARQLDRVRANLTNGARLSWSLGDLLIQSVNNPGQVYSVSARGCTCPNGAAGRTSCWHVALFDLIVEMADDHAAAADILVDAAAEREAQAEARRALGERIAAARRNVWA